MDNKIEIKDLSLIFGSKKGEAKKLMKEGKSKEEILEKTGCTVAVKNASLEIKPGEVFVIMGLSGSGKSTLLRCLNRLIEPTMGQVFVNGEDITGYDDKQLLGIRRKQMSMVFQHFGLLPHRTVLSNVGFGMEIQGISVEERNKKAMESVEIVGLQGYENMMTSELSGGMQQRVGLARALANDPEVLLMDEAFSALDPLIRSQMQDELLLLQEKVQKTIVFITHDLDEAIKLGERIAIMNNGEIVQIGTAEEILTRPANDYVTSFVENIDRTSIITAGTLMFKQATKARLKHDGPETVMRKMREAGVNVLPVVRTNQTFMGYVYLEDVLKLKKEGKKTIEDALISDVPSVYPDATVGDMLPLIKDSQFQVAVVNEQNHLLGLVTQTSIIIEATGHN
ncbi:MAG TPA: glycine betaine/L-proline ABC transporter ATP-binding protein, partial [Bacteroidales bacterium]|nr:glycine betaine/L-proline ABC transporter ATP-binding protein [Bacteroidales bacterium]